MGIIKGIIKNCHCEMISSFSFLYRVLISNTHFFPVTSCEELTEKPQKDDLSFFFLCTNPLVQQLILDQKITMHKTRNHRGQI